MMDEKKAEPRIWVRFEKDLLPPLPIEAYVSQVWDARELGGKAAALVEEQLENMNTDGRKIVEDLLKGRAEVAGKIPPEKLTDGSGDDEEE